jgi:microcystin-dependent protein
MPEPYYGEIRLFSCSFAPKGWALCNGQLLPINQNQALFSLLGTMYGGDGRVNFALPDMRGRVAMHQGSGWTVGERTGEAAHTLSLQEIPLHSHALRAAASTANSGAPSTARSLATAQGAAVYGTPTNLVPMAPEAVGNFGGSQPHENQQPFTVISFCIALFGLFPSRN